MKSCIVLMLTEAHNATNVLNINVS